MVSTLDISVYLTNDRSPAADGVLVLGGWWRLLYFVSFRVLRLRLVLGHVNGSALASPPVLELASRLRSPGGDAWCHLVSGRRLVP